MIVIIVYLFLLLTGIASLGFAIASNYFTISTDFHLPIYCVLSGGIGGVIYCFRAIYLNYCVKQQWDKRWYVWYILRPMVSLVAGGVAFLFLKTGLLVLESNPEIGATSYGFYALAFIAGLNVEKFIKKIEEVAQSTWGIEKSRATSEAEKNKNGN